MPELEGEVALRTHQGVDRRVGRDQRRLERAGEGFDRDGGRRDGGREGVVAAGLDRQRVADVEGEGCRLGEIRQQVGHVDLNHIGVAAGRIEDVVKRGRAGCARGAENWKTVLLPDCDRSSSATRSSAGRRSPYTRPNCVSSGAIAVCDHIVPGLIPLPGSQTRRSCRP